MGNKQSTADLIADIKRDHPQSGRAAVATGTTTPPPCPLLLPAQRHPICRRRFPSDH